MSCGFFKNKGTAAEVTHDSDPFVDSHYVNWAELEDF